MAFRDNSVLIRTATAVDVDNNNADDTYDAGGGATAFVIEAGLSGDDTFLNFGSDDTIINNRRIFDGNGDGFIQFGPNGVLDIDRTGGGASRAGPDQFQLVGAGDAAILELRYLGSKGDSATSGQHVYADSATLRNLATAFADTDLQDESGVVEGTVGNDTINAGAGATYILQDNGLGLNLGGDTITGFGDDDLLITTVRLFDSTGDETVEFFNNQVLDVSGVPGPNGSDPASGPGGQLDFNSPDRQSIEYLGTATIGGVEYFFYGTAGFTGDLPTGDA